MTTRAPRGRPLADAIGVLLRGDPALRGEFERALRLRSALARAEAGWSVAGKLYPAAPCQLVAIWSLAELEALGRVAARTNFLRAVRGTELWRDELIRAAWARAVLKVPGNHAMKRDAERELIAIVGEEPFIRPEFDLYEALGRLAYSRGDFATALRRLDQTRRSLDGFPGGWPTRAPKLLSMLRSTAPTEPAVVAFEERLAQARRRVRLQSAVDRAQLAASAGAYEAGIRQLARVTKLAERLPRAMRPRADGAFAELPEEAWIDERVRRSAVVLLEPGWRERWRRGRDRLAALE